MHSTVSSEIITILFCPLFLGVVVEEFRSFLCLPLEFGGDDRFFLPSKTEEIRFVSEAVGWDGKLFKVYIRRVEGRRSGCSEVIRQII